MRSVPGIPWVYFRISNPAKLRPLREKEGPRMAAFFRVALLPLYAPAPFQHRHAAPVLGRAGNVVGDGDGRSLP